MPISILAKYVCERKTDIFADVVNEQFGKTPNDIIRETMEKYSNPSQSGSDTPSHAKVTSRLMGVMVDAINAKHPDTFSEQDKNALIVGSLLHDIGKTAVPVNILDKQGRPTAEEFDRIKTHTVAGNRILGKWLAKEQLTDFQRQSLELGQQMACYHHERPDGKGYPLGMVGDEIPYAAKMMAVVDVLEALTAQRAYKPSMSFEKAESIIREGAGTQFDANLVDIFFSNEKARSEANTIIDEGRFEKANACVGEDR